MNSKSQKETTKTNTKQKNKQQRTNQTLTIPPSTLQHKEKRQNRRIKIKK